MIRIRLSDDIIYKHRGFVCEYLSNRLTEDEWITKLSLPVINYINRKMNDIVCGQPYLLLEINSELKTNFNLNKITDGGLTINTHLRDLFSYDDFSRGINGFRDWDAYALAYELDVRTCPYCNRVYINTVINRGENVIRPAFDHFYCKNVYPLLSLSIFNLVPSCTSCNSSLKGQKDFGLAEYIHPLVEGFDNDGVFTYDPHVGGGFFNHTIENTRILIDSTHAPNEKRDRIIRNTSVFEINTIYTNSHMNVLNDIRTKCRMVSENLDFYINLGLNIEDLYNFIFSSCLNPDDYLRYPLSKFIKDIVTELGVIERLNQVLR